MSRRSNRRAVWTVPVLLGVVSALGLAAALLFDTWGNWLSWATLAAVTAVSLWICVLALAPKRWSRDRFGDVGRGRRGSSSFG